MFSETQTNILLTFVLVKSTQASDEHTTCDFSSSTANCSHESVCVAWVCPQLLKFGIISRRLALQQQTLDFVVDVGGILGCYLLNYVHRGPVVTAHTLIMTTDHAVRSLQRTDNIAAVWAVVVAADAVPLWHSQSVEGHRSRLLAIWDAVTVMVPPQQGQQNYDDQKDDHAARDNPHERSWLRATAATGVCLSCFWACICHERPKKGRRNTDERVNQDTRHRDVKTISLSLCPGTSWSVCVNMKTSVKDEHQRICSNL